MGYRNHCEREHRRCDWSSQTSLEGTWAGRWTLGNARESGTTGFAAGCCPTELGDSGGKVVCIYLRAVAETTMQRFFIILRKYLKIFDD